jgi:hypothetical protein
MLSEMPARTLIVLLAGTLLATATARAQTTWYVDDDAPNDPGPGDPMVSDPQEDGSAAHPFDAIQEGIDAADPNDTVLVLDGIYTGPGNKDLDFGGQAITLRSENGPDNCLIDCEGDPNDPHRGFYFHSAETTAALVRGLTITAGNMPDGWGGGICVENGSSPTVRACRIVGNAACKGGGVSCSASDPTLDGCLISGNTAFDWCGGGVYCDASAPQILNCTISENAADYEGSGVCCFASSAPLISDCLITENIETTGGAGIACIMASSPTIRRCTLSNNTAGRGGALCCYESDPLVFNCLIVGNTALSHGGGIELDISSPTFTNCLIVGNSAAQDGGGIVHYGGSPELINCTITGNFAGAGGGVFGSSELRIRNTILWGDAPDEIDIPTHGTAPSVAYSDVQGGWDGDGNTDAAPGFADPDGPDDDPATWEDNDFRLGAPTCIDAGSNDAVLPDVADLDGDDDMEEPLPVDLDGLPRFADVPGTPDAGQGTPPIVDMGAYEFEATIPLIGFSPATLEFSAPESGPDPVEQVLVIRNAGGGTLNWEISEDCPWLEVDPSSGQCADETDEVVVSVDVADLPYGEHACELSISDTSAPNSPTVVPVQLVVFRFLYVPSEYSTIQAAIDATAMDGDVVLVADGTYAGAGNKNLDFGGRRIAVRSENGPDNCIIDCENDGRGFRFYSDETADSVVDGFTITNGNAAYGGGIRSSSYSSPTITNCRIIGNTAGRGGGIFCYWESHPTITNCEIIDNVASALDGGGGGIGCYVGSNPTIVNCTIVQNTADWGGGIQIDNADGGASRPMLINCVLAQNVGTYGGGAVDCNADSGPTFLNCVITDNSSGSIYGGAIWCSGDDMLLVNCVVANNNTDGDGGAVWLYLYASPRFTNCVFSGNSADGTGGAFYCGYASHPVLTNCTITGNNALEGALYCSPGSGPTITNSILWGDTPSEIWSDSAGPVVTYCDVQGGWPGEGNIYADPLLVDPDGPDNDPNTWEDNDYRLNPGSPCIDAGDNTAVPPDLVDLDEDGDTDERIPFDLEGNPRFVQDPFTDDTGVPDPPCYRHIVDMGAYEFQFCFGDLDGDDDIDLADLAQLLGSYGDTSGVTYYNGDLDGDGDVDLADVAELLGVYGTTCE